MEIFGIINVVICSAFSILLAYKVLLVILGLFKTRKFKDAKEEHTFAVLIAGRNESAVIANLIASIKAQNYDQQKIKIFMVADNCTDDTFEVASNAGMAEGAETFVFKRFNKEKVGKGYALDFLLDQIHATLPDYNPDAFLVFDADNLLDKNYVYEINKVLDEGYKICTSYRNGKNFGENYISANMSMCFLRECRFLHAPRSVINSSTFISGTGFMVASDVLTFEGGWKYTTLTEDIEFSASNILNDNVITYCDKAMFYDEQPTDMKASYNQRMRWQKGFYQTFAIYGKSLFKGIGSSKGFAKYEMFLMLLPITPIMFTWSVLFFFINNGFYLFADFHIFCVNLSSFIINLFLVCVGVMLYGALILIRERKRIKLSLWQKIKYSFTFPFFLLTYIPIAYECLFKKVYWKHIPHTSTVSIEQIAANSSVEQVSVNVVD